MQLAREMLHHKTAIARKRSFVALTWRSDAEWHLYGAPRAVFVALVAWLVPVSRRFGGCEYPIHLSRPRRSCHTDEIIP